MSNWRWIWMKDLTILENGAFSSTLRYQCEGNRPRSIHCESSTEEVTTKESQQMQTGNRLCGRQQHSGSSSRGCRSGCPPSWLPVSIALCVTKEGQWGTTERRAINIHLTQILVPKKLWRATMVTTEFGCHWSFTVEANLLKHLGRWWWLCRTVML